MSSEVVCHNCGKKFDNSGDYVCPDWYDNYYCLKCAREIVDNFNNLVQGEAGLNNNDEVGISLGDIAKLLNMLERKGPDFCFIITDKKRYETIKSYESSRR